MSTRIGKMSCAVIAGLVCVCAAGTSAQVLMRATEPPAVTATSESWYLAGDPVVFNGVLFHKVGAQVFFDGDVMVRAGTFQGTPLYVDTTLEPNSVVFVPVDGGMLQPYERVRDGDLAGTTGSRTPWFPVTPATLETGRGMPMAQGPPTGSAPRPPVRMDGAPVGGSAAEPAVVGTGGVVSAADVPRSAPEYRPGTWRSARVPEGTRGVWIDYNGQRWVACGRAEPLDAQRFSRSGEYRGFPVFTQPGTGDGERVYLPSLEGFVAPYLRPPTTRDATGQCTAAAGLRPQG